MESAVASSTAFDLRLRGIGCFSRAVWLGIDDHDQLAVLVERLAAALSEVGFTRESRPFQPHLTVARLKRHARVPLSTLIDRYARTDWGLLPVNSLHLYQSHTEPDGARYEIRHTVTLPISGPGNHG